MQSWYMVLDTDVTNSRLYAKIKIWVLRETPELMIFCSLHYREFVN